MIYFLKAGVKEAQQELNKQKDLLKECNKDITEKTREHKDLSKELSDTDLKMTEYEHKLTKCNKEAKDADRTVCRLFLCDTTVCFLLLLAHF